MFQVWVSIYYYGLMVIQFYITVLKLYRRIFSFYFILEEIGSHNNYTGFIVNGIKLNRESLLVNFLREVVRVIV